jgi:UTP--glucose-1-phosphate uridylyltransferase
MASPIRKVVFPVAGLGTRFLPATRAVPKEMIPVVDKPLIQYAVEEAAKAGITDMVFVTAAGKEAIMNHFDYSYELWNELQSKGKKELLDVVRSICPPGFPEGAGGRRSLRKACYRRFPLCCDSAR